MANVIVSPHQPRRFEDDDSLVTRQAAAYFVDRHPDVISRNVAPVACDVPSRMPLYSLSDVCGKVATLRRRRVA
jgi:hypothetical protein